MEKKEMNITEILSAYLPYDIDVLTHNGISKLERVKVGHTYDGYKPILKNINDITMLEVMSSGYYTLAELMARLKEDRLYFNSVRYLLSLKYDLFGLIESERALDIKNQPIKNG